VSSADEIFSQVGCVSALILGVPNFALGQSIAGSDPTKEARNRGTYQPAIPFVRTAAENGNAKSASFMGTVYAYGYGVAQSDVEAF